MPNNVHLYEHFLQLNCSPLFNVFIRAYAVRGFWIFSLRCYEFKFQFQCTHYVERQLFATEFNCMTAAHSVALFFSCYNLLCVSYTTLLSLIHI